MAKQSGARSASKPAPPSRPRSGRPTRAESAQLEERLRRAALESFLEHGFDGTTMEAVARAAGIAKRTLYARYPDKEALFVDVVPPAIGGWEEPLPDFDPEDLTGALLAIGRSAVKRVTHPDLVRLGRVAMQEAARFPQFARSAYTLTWSPRMRAVMALLERHADRGQIVVDDLELAAEHFLSLVSLMPGRLADFGVYRDPDEEERHLQFAVRLFLRGVLPR